MAKSISLVLRNLKLHYFEGTDAREEPFFVRAHMSCDASKEIMEEFGFDPIPNSFKGVHKLLGEAIGSHIILTPNGGKLGAKMPEMQFAFTTANNFQIANEKDKDDDQGTRPVIRFALISRENGAAAKIEEYKRSNRRHGAAGKMVYSAFNREPKAKGADDGSGQMTITDAQDTAAQAVAAAN